MVNINIPLPTSCASCPLSVRHFGKLYCPPLNDRVGNEGKDARCPLVDAEGRGDLISREDAIEAISYSIELCNKALDSMTLGGRDRYAVEVERNSLLKLKDDFKLLQSAQPTLTNAESNTELSVDLISRADALSCFHDWIDKYGDVHTADEMPEYQRIEQLPDAQPEQRYTEEELRVFKHGISLSLLSKRSSQHWQYDEDTATEIKFLERLYEKVSADMRGEQDG